MKAVKIKDLHPGDIFCFAWDEDREEYQKGYSDDSILVGNWFLFLDGSGRIEKEDNPNESVYVIKSNW